MHAKRRKFTSGERVALILTILPLVVVYLNLFEGADLADLDKNEQFIFTFGVSIAAIGLFLSFGSGVTAQQYQVQSMHQAIGGYIPSDKLNVLVWKHFLRQGGIVKRIEKENFISKWKDTEKILIFTDNFVLEENISKQIAYCEIERNGDFYKAISASKEMALCIAFLKSCGVKTDQEFNEI